MMGATVTGNKPRTPPITVRRPNPAGLSPAEQRAWETQQGRPNFVSGNTIIKAGARGTRPDPAWLVHVVRGEWDKAEPRVVQLGSMPQPLNINVQQFPVSTPQLGGFPGAQYSAGQVGQSAALAPIIANEGWPVACVLEYGSGVAGQRVMFDWVPGAFNLPPCSFVDVSILPWGPLFASSWNDTIFGASVGPGNLQNAFVPTVSGRWQCAEGAHIFIPKPDHARGFDVFPVSPAIGSLTLSVACSAVRDFGGNAYNPSWSPLDVSPAESGVQVDCTDGGGFGFLNFLGRWFLSL